MSSSAAYSAIHDRLVAQWTDTVLIFENDALVDPDTQAPFVYVEIYGDMLQQETIGAPGANTWLEDGAAYLHVMVPDGTGSQGARTLADQLANLFREVPAGAMYFEDISIGAGEPGRSFPNFWALTVTIGWRRRSITGA